MTTTELQTLLAGATPPLLVHVLPEEVFAAQRIAGSKNACVYEVAFFEQIKAISSDNAQSIVVYGAGGGSLDAQVAAAKLTAAGYTNVQAFEGGIEAWQAAGLPLEGNAAIPRPAALTGTYTVNANESLIRWTGRNLFNHHSGTMLLAQGGITLRDNALVSAQFSIAMDSMACEDIPDSGMNQMLIGHLKSDDFFDTANHPTAEFIADRITPIAASTEGTPNYHLHGRLTLRGMTREIDFPIVVAADGNRLTAQGLLDLDRTQFGSIYGSGRLFRFLGKHIVNDHVHLHIKLHAELNA